MPKIKYGAGVVTASGGFSGNVFSRNASGSYSRTRTKPKKSSTNSQLKSCSCQSKCARAWQTLLSDDQRSLWIVYASQVPVLNRIGDISRLSGQQTFIQANLARCFCDLPFVLVPSSVLEHSERDPSVSVVLSP